MSLWNQIKSNPKFLYLIGMSLMIVSALVQIELPILVDTPVKDFKAAIDALNPGDNIYIAQNIGPELAGDTLEAAIVIIKYLVESDLDILIYSPVPTDDPFTIEMMEGVLGENYQEHPYYGERIVDLGYVPGAVLVVLQHANDIRLISPLDRFGVHIDNYAATQEFNGAADMDLIVGFGAGPLNAWPPLLTVPYNLKTLYLYHAGGKAMVSINYLSGQCEGYVAGVGQGAQLELITGIQGNNLSYVSANFLVMGFAFIGLVGTNILYLYQRFTGNNKQNKEEI